MPYAFRSRQREILSENVLKGGCLSAYLLEKIDTAKILNDFIEGELNEKIRSFNSYDRDDLLDYSILLDRYNCIIDIISLKLISQSPDVCNIKHFITMLQTACINSTDANTSKTNTNYMVILYTLLDIALYAINQGCYNQAIAEGAMSLEDSFNLVFRSDITSKEDNCRKAIQELGDSSKRLYVTFMHLLVIELKLNNVRTAKDYEKYLKSKRMPRKLKKFYEQALILEHEGYLEYIPF